MPDFLVRISGLPSFHLTRKSPGLRIGRSPDQDIILEDPAISRSHARLAWVEGQAFLEDLGSRHGCFVNGVRLRAAKRVGPGDSILLGPVSLLIEESSPDTTRSDSREAEVTLAIPVEGLQGWRPGGGITGGYSDWRRGLDLFHEFSLALLEDHETETLLGTMLDRLFRFLEARRGAVLLRTGQGDLRELAARAGEDAGDSPFGPAPATVKAAIERREAVLLKDNQPQSEAATSSVMAVPLEHGGEVLGLFYFDAGGGRPPFTEDDLRFVASFGHLAAAKLIQQRMASDLRHQREMELEIKAAETANEAKSEFLAHMSHEIRTPLNAILGFLHLVQREDHPPKVAGYLEKIEQSGRSLMGLLNDILDLSKIEAGKFDMEAIPFRVEEVLQSVTDGLGHRAEEKGLALTVSVEMTEAEALLGDPLRLGQVLLNLVSNALKFTESGGVHIQVEAAPASAGLVRLLFTVKDTGIGMSEAEASKLFSAYSQGHSSIPRRFGGTGLGLVISKRLVERMGGDIRVESQPGAGSTFSFSAQFPLAQAQPPSASTRPPAGSGAIERPFENRRLLLVEDNTISRQLGLILLGEAGFQVDAADGGEKAVRMALEKKYDAILMDIEMPGVDGYEATRRIREGAGNRNLPIIAVTAHALSTHRTRCLAAGMNDCITKPIAPRQLFDILGAWIQPEDSNPGGDGTPRDLEDLKALTEVMDVPLALDLIGGRKDLLLRFLKRFLDDPVGAESIRAAMDRGDVAAARTQAHDLKGIAGALALPDVAEAARSLESRLGQASIEDWEPHCLRLGQALDRVRACARDLDHLPPP